MRIGRSTRGDRLPVSTQYGSQQQRTEAQAALLERQVRASRDGRTGIAVESQRDRLIRHQGITITATLAGPQWTRATVGNRAQKGAYVTVTVGTIVMTFRDAATLRSYAAEWIAAGAAALQLPKWVPQDAHLNTYREPGVVIAAAPSDKTAHRYVKARGLLIRAGQITWQVQDRNAFTGVAEMWATLDAEAADLIPD